MKYTYAYKTSDGKRHEAEMDAPSREDVFVALRAKGIRAIKVVAADGSKANGEWGTGNGEQGTGKDPPSPRLRMARGIFRITFSFLVLLLATLAIHRTLEFRSDLNSTNSNGLTGRGADRRIAAPRHQIYGDPAVTGGFEVGDFGDALPREGDRLLAWFSQPGRVTCPKGTSPAALRRLDDSGVAALAAVAGSDEALAESDSREVQELKQIVNGMRREMREYLANGNGTPRSYWRRLLERTREEAQIYENARRELEKVRDQAVWDERNAALRRLGLRTIPNPRDAE